MRIENSSVALASARAATTVDTTSLRARAWVGVRPPEAGGMRVTSASGAAAVALSQRALSMAAAGAAAGAAAARATVAAHAAAVAADAAAPGLVDGTGTDDEALPSDPRLRVLIRLIERLTGRKVRILRLDGGTSGAVPGRAGAATSAGGAAPSRPPAGWGAEIDTEHVHEEQERTTFAARGTVQTDDGRTISFDLGLSMSRSYSERSTTQIRLGDAARPATDPLSLSLDGAPVRLRESRSAFDLNGDGADEHVALPATGSAFLALDRNGNGTIDDGTELFGPTTGDGFAELAALDGDGNGWIDEADPAFYRLRLWTGSEPAGASGANGQSLTEAGVGAIFTGAVSTAFDLRSATNEQLGRDRSSGVYLAEDGTAKPVQQVDLTA